MKPILTILLFACALSAGSCSRSDKQPDTTTQQQTTKNSNLKADAERLQRATMKAAEERRRAQEQQSPTPTPTP